jgi:hypothetical protein
MCNHKKNQIKRGGGLSKNKTLAPFGEEKFHFIICPQDILENSKEKDW